MCKPLTNAAVTRNRSGFTLVEALASLLLVAMVLPFVMRGISLAAKAGAQADREATAVLLAQTVMDEVILTDTWTYGDADGEFDEAFGREAERFTWVLTVNDWQSTEFRELTVTVRWVQGGDEQSVDLKTVVYAGAGVSG